MSSFAGIQKVKGGEWTNEEMTLVKDLLFLFICRLFAAFHFHLSVFVYIEGHLEEEAGCFCRENESTRV